MVTSSSSSNSSRSQRPQIVGPEIPQTPYPLFADTTIIAGFGRGSSDLGIPTANIPPDSYDPILKATSGIEASDTGIYYGYAAVYPGSPENLKSCEERNQQNTLNPQARDIKFSYGQGLERGTDSYVVHPMVMSVGWNPFYGNKTRSAEIYIIHKFYKDKEAGAGKNDKTPAQFYGARIKFVVLGYIRPELDYVSVEALIEDINTDVRVALKSLERPAYSKFKEDPFFTQVK